MEVLDLFPDETQHEQQEPPPKKILILALARDSKGLEAKNFGDALHKRLPGKYQKPLVKVFHDADWRDFQRRLRKSTGKWDYLATCAIFIDGALIGNDDDFKEYLKNEYSLMIDQKPLKRFAEFELMDKIGKNPSKSYVFFDVKIHEKKTGRMIFEVDSYSMPKSTKQFLELCCYQKLIPPDGINHRDQFHGAVIKRIVNDSWMEVQIPNKVCTDDNRHEPPSLKHDRRGTLSLSYDKHRRIISSHFVITLDECHWMDKYYRAIGRLIEGESVLHTIENVKTAYERPLLSVVISHCGILYSPSMMTTADFDDVLLTNAAKLMKVVRESYRATVKKRLSQKPLEITEGDDSIEFAYSVPREVVEERTTIQWDPEAQRPSYIKNVSVTTQPKEPSRTQLETIAHFSGKRAESPEKKEPVKTEPFGRESDEYNYYQFATRTLKKVTPRLLLAWAHGIDDHYKNKNISEEIERFLENAVDISRGTQGDVPHSMDVPSGMMYPERYFKCLYSLPTELLTLLREMIDDHFERVDPPRRALSDDVISAHMLAIIDVTRRMIESTTDLVQSLENFDLVGEMIDELILKKIEEFEERKQKWVKQVKKRISPFVTPSESAERSQEVIASSDFPRLSQTIAPATEGPAKEPLDYTSIMK